MSIFFRIYLYNFRETQENNLNWSVAAAYGLAKTPSKIQKDLCDRWEPLKLQILNKRRRNKNMIRNK